MAGHSVTHDGDAFLLISWSDGLHELKDERDWQMKVPVIVAIGPRESARSFIILHSVARPDEISIIQGCATKLRIATVRAYETARVIRILENGDVANLSHFYCYSDLADRMCRFPFVASFEF